MHESHSPAFLSVSAHTMEGERLVAPKHRRRKDGIWEEDIAMMPIDNWSDGWSGEEEAAISTELDDEDAPALFPMKLFFMLRDAEKEGFTDVVSWGKLGDSFRVHDKTKFEQSILPKYFKMTKYKSFTRQLHNYGFAWANRGPDKGGYSHPDFTRKSNASNSPLLCRKPKKKRKRRNLDSPKKLDAPKKTTTDGSLPLQLFQDGSVGAEKSDDVFLPRRLLQEGSTLEELGFPLPSGNQIVVEPRTIEEMVSEPRMLPMEEPLSNQILFTTSMEQPFNFQSWPGRFESR